MKIQRVKWHSYEWQYSQIKGGTDDDCIDPRGKPMM